MQTKAKNKMKDGTSKDMGLGQILWTKADTNVKDKY